MDNGNVSSQETVKGAIRTFKCNSWYDMVGTELSVCGEDGEWSFEAPNTTTTVTALPAQRVTCVFTFDNFLESVYADGKRLTLVGDRQGEESQGSAPKVFFKDSVKVITIRGRDIECGCKCGGMMFSCTVDGERESQWHTFVSRAGDKQIRGRASYNARAVDKFGKWLVPEFVNDDRFEKEWQPASTPTGGHAVSENQFQEIDGIDSDRGCLL